MQITLNNPRFVVPIEGLFGDHGQSQLNGNLLMLGHYIHF